MEGELLNRAIAAYYRRATKNGEIPQQPSSSSSGVTENNGKDYVVLRNVNGILAVYRVTNTGQLKHLKRWPKDIS